MEYYINSLNNSKIFSGCLSLYTTIFGKNFIKELPENIDKVYDFFLLRYILVFAFSFLSTRSIIHSILLTLIFIIFSKYLLNQNSRTCITKKIINKKLSDIDNNENISIEDVINAQNIIKNYNKIYLKSNLLK